MKITKEILLHATPFLELIMLNYLDHNEEGKTWYGVRRVNSIPAVTVAALTPDQNILFVTQNRPMVGGETIELPAGLMDKPGESVIDVARRELLEETGYAGDDFSLLIGGTRGLTVTAGLTNERLFLVLARDVARTTLPLEDEGTKPVSVPIDKAYVWLQDQVAQGKDVDYKLFGTIRLIEKEVPR